MFFQSRLSTSRFELSSRKDHFVSLGLYCCFCCLVFSCFAFRLAAQDAHSEPVRAFSNPSISESNSSFLLGIDDQVIVRALHVPEIPTEPVRIDGQGDLTLPLVGSIHVAGLTVAQAQALLASRLQAVVRQPEVTISTMELRSRPVYVLGAVTRPGEYQIQGRKTLAGLLSQCEGMRNDAGSRVLVTRQLSEGPIPLPFAVTDAAAGVSKVTLRLDDVTRGSTSAANLYLKPNDVVSIPRADMVYVVGDVKKAGGIVLEERDSISLLQALSLAEGTLPTAAGEHSKILSKAETGGLREEKTVNLKSILDGRSKDIELHSNDVLFVPTSKTKGVWTRSLEAAVQMATGVVIWRL